MILWHGFRYFQILFSIESSLQNHRAMSGREALANAAALAATAFELFVQSAAPNVHRFGDLDQVWILGIWGQDSGFSQHGGVQILFKL